MWKSGIQLREATYFYPQANVEEAEVFNRGCGREKQVEFFHSFLFHIPQTLWRVSDEQLVVSSYGFPFGDVIL